MNPQQWLDEVRKELQTRRLPRRSVTRLMRELSDHLTDGWEQTMNTDVRVVTGPDDRLGSPRQIAELAEREFQASRFAARHPLVTFCLLPVVVFPFVAAAAFTIPAWLIVSCLAVFGVDEWLATDDELLYGAWIPGFAKCYIAGTIVAAAGIVVWAMARLARRSRVTARWPCVSAALVALLAGCIWSDVTPKTPEKMGTMMLGLGYPIRAWTIFQTGQMLAPLGFAAWLMRPKQTSEAAPTIQVERAA